MRVRLLGFCNLVYLQVQNNTMARCKNEDANGATRAVKRVVAILGSPKVFNRTDQPTKQTNQTTATHERIHSATPYERLPPFLFFFFKPPPPQWYLFQRDGACGFVAWAGGPFVDARATLQEPGRGLCRQTRKKERVARVMCPGMEKI